MGQEKWDRPKAIQSAIRDDLLKYAQDLGKTVERDKEAGRDRAWYYGLGQIEGLRYATWRLGYNVTPIENAYWDARWEERNRIKQEGQGYDDHNQDGPDQDDQD